MRVRRTESSGDVTIEVFIDDWPKDNESQEVFEERLLRFAERLTMLDTQPAAEEKEGG